MKAPNFNINDYTFYQDSKTYLSIPKFIDVEINGLGVKIYQCSGAILPHKENSYCEMAIVTDIAMRIHGFQLVEAKVVRQLHPRLIAHLKYITSKMKPWLERYTNPKLGNLSFAASRRLAYQRVLENSREARKD